MEVRFTVHATNDDQAEKMGKEEFRIWAKEWRLSLPEQVDVEMRPVSPSTTIRYTNNSPDGLILQGTKYIIVFRWRA